MRRAFRTFAVAACFLAGAVSASCHPRAPARQEPKAFPATPRTLRELVQAADAAHAAHDDREYRARLGDLQARIGVTPGLALEIVHTETRLGHADAALDWLRRYASMGLSLEDADSSADLAPLRGRPAWDAIAEQLSSNARPVSSATLALRLPDEDLLAEDLAWDPVARTFYVSAVRARTILAVRADDGEARRFVAAGQDGLWSVFGLGVDAVHRRLWATTAAVPQADTYESTDAGRTAVYLYDLTSAKLIRRIELSSPASSSSSSSPSSSPAPPAPAQAHALTDITVGRDAAAYVSDALGGRVFVARANGPLEALDDGHTFLSPQTGALSADGRTLLVPDYGLGIAAIDLASHAVRWLAHDESIALTGIDGLYFADAQTLVAVQNGTDPARVVRLAVDPSLTRVTGLDVLEQQSVWLGAPTHGVVKDGEFWFIGRSGWEHMADDGSPKPGESPRGSVILRLRVR